MLSRRWLAPILPFGSGQQQTLAPRQANAGDPFIITRTCRRAYRAYWQLNANQLSSGNDAKSLDATRELKAP